MGEIHRIDESNGHPTTELPGDTPTLRLFALLEMIASKDQLFTLQGLVEETGMAKPTLHRMLQQLEGAGLLTRQNNGRHYGTGVRLRRFAENLLLNDTHHGARHAILRNLVAELGESCNVTTLSGSEVVYLDRVETSEPLRFTLHAGSRVPAHCSASGKMILSQLSPAQRRRLLGRMPLERYTNKTVTDVELIETELKQVRRDATPSTTRSSCPASCAPRCSSPAPQVIPISASQSRPRSCDSPPTRRSNCYPRCGGPPTPSVRSRTRSRTTERQT